MGIPGIPGAAIMVVVDGLVPRSMYLGGDSNGVKISSFVNSGQFWPFFVRRWKAAPWDAFSILAR
jgi:hypothetical protein